MYSTSLLVSVYQKKKSFVRAEKKYLFAHGSAPDESDKDFIFFIRPERAANHSLANRSQNKLRVATR